MDIIKKLSIKALKISGFKCHKEKREFRFGDINLIAGGNHTGKTTIADAVSFAVTGQGFWGGHVIDKFYNEDNPDITIEMIFTDEYGKEHSIYRKRRKDKMDIAYDGQIARQQDLSFVFGERDEFLSMLNPLYFIEELSENGGALLEKHLPPIAHDKVMQALSESYRELLNGIEFSSPEMLLKALREEKRECEDTIAAIEGQQQLLDLQGMTRENKASQLAKEIKELEGEIACMLQKKTEGFNEKTLRDELAMLSLKHDEMLHDAPKPMNAEEYAENLRQITDKLYAAKARAYESKYAAAIDDMTQQLNAEKLRYRQLAALREGMKDGAACPQCLRKISKNDLPDMHEEADKRLVPCVANGCAVKARLKDLHALDEKSKASFLKFQAEDIESLEKERLKLEANWKNVQSNFEQKQRAHTEEVQSIYLQIQEIDEQLLNGKLTIEETISLKGMEEKLLHLKGMYAQLCDKTESGDYKLDEQLKLLQMEINQKTAVISALIEYTAKKAELLFESLSTKNVRCQLYEIVKTTGELKKTFKVTYKGRDYRRLSRSERLLAGMEVTQLLRTLTGKCYPVFVDDSESIENIPKPECQIFLARVVRGAELSVRSTSRKKALLPKAV